MGPRTATNASWTPPGTHQHFKQSQGESVAGVESLQFAVVSTFAMASDSGLFTDAHVVEMKFTKSKSASREHVQSVSLLLHPSVLQGASSAAAAVDPRGRWTPEAGGSQSALKVPFPGGSQPSSMVSSLAAFYTLSFENL